MIKLIHQTINKPFQAKHNTNSQKKTDTNSQNQIHARKQNPHRDHNKPFQAKHITQSHNKNRHQPKTQTQLQIEKLEHKKQSETKIRCRHWLHIILSYLNHRAIFRI